MKRFFSLITLIQCVIIGLSVQAQIGTRFPSERKIIQDPVTGIDLVFLTSTPAGDRKIYPTHNQWTSDGKWIVFSSARVPGEAMAVNEETGEIVQITEGGYSGMLSVARESMKLYYMREPKDEKTEEGAVEVIEVDLQKVFTDSELGKMKPAAFYERVCGVTPPEMRAGGDMALDGGEEWVWFRVGKEEALKHLPEGTEIVKPFGPRKMGAGPAGIAGMNIRTGEIKHVVSVPFQVGHIQSNPWVPGQILFCWETGGKSPQRTWIVHADGTGLRPLYRESEYEWITHEAVISPDEVAFAIMGHRPIPGIEDENRPEGTDVRGANPGQEKEWGPSGTREKPTGLGIVNINTREMFIAGQIPYGSGFWHVHGSPDKRFVVGDNFSRELYLINRETNEMMLLTAGHKVTAADHVHPTFSPDGTKIEIQSAMLSEDGRAMNICIVPVPEKWLKRDTVAGIPVNYDEAKTGTWQLPDLMTLENGDTVTNTSDWIQKRRPEIIRLYETEQYGKAPERIKQRVNLFEPGTPAREGKAVRKQVTLYLTEDTASHKADLLIYLPADAKGPVPLFLMVSFMPNAMTVDDPAIRSGYMWNREGERVPVQPGSGESRMRGLDVDKFISQGFGVATLYYGDIEPDFADGIRYGVRGHYLPEGKEWPEPNEWGTISAWAWGLGYAMDYLETDPDIDATKVALHGVSRLGKTVLWTGALDQRFAMVLASCSGEGGAALSMRDYGETIAHMVAPSRYFYQFCGNRARYADNPQSSPIDAHMLLSLMAPRPLLLQTGDTDGWSDPKGEFLAAIAAGPVYNLFGKKGLETDEMAEAGIPILHDLGYYMHAGGHGTLPEDYDVFIDFMRKHFLEGESQPVP